MPDWNLPSVYRYKGQEVRYRIEGDGEPIVLVHGTPWSSFNWRHLFGKLTSNWKVHTYDFIGYGQSEKKDGQDVSLGVQSQLLDALIEHWKVERPVVIGHDYGGATSLRTAIINKRDYQALILCDPVAISPWGSPFFSHVKEHEVAFRGVPDYIHEAIVSAYIAGAMHSEMTDETREGILKPWKNEKGRAAFYRQIAQADSRFTKEVEDRYLSIRCPTLILWGEEDNWIPIERGRELHRRMPASTFVSIANAGHLVQEDQPQLLFEHIERFLKKVKK